MVQNSQETDRCPLSAEREHPASPAYQQSPKTVTYVHRLTSDLFTLRVVMGNRMFSNSLFSVTTAFKRQRTNGYSAPPLAGLSGSSVFLSPKGTTRRHSLPP